jgi:cyclopropane fatty-acyl-phospholipid synthase-like methyltransferase
MGRVVEPENAAAFWEARYAQGRLYGTAPTSVALRLATLFHSHGVRTLLEAGCGSGRDVLFYARQGFEVTGTDLSQNALGWARRQAEVEGLTLRLLLDDLGETRLPANAFDATVAIHVVHLQPAPVRQTMANQLWRLTRDGGLIAMANYSTDEAGFSTWDPYPEPGTRVDPKGKLVHFFTAEDLQALHPAARFEWLVREEVDLAELLDSGPVTHREWLSVARKVRAC